LDVLFPSVTDGNDAVQHEVAAAPLVITGAVDPEVPEITRDELDRAVRRMAAKNTVPGPDGVPGRILAFALGALGEKLRRYFNELLSHGWFLKEWKEGFLVLLRKEGRPADSPSAFRPVVLLDEAGKLFERVLAARLVAHMEQVGPDLSDRQLGFRGGRLTIDAILRVKTFVEESVRDGGVLIAVSLDIKNAFNTLP